MANTPVADSETWLRLLCRFQVQYGVSLVPSAEEISSMLNSSETWPDVVQYDPEIADYVVVSDSTLVWGGTKRDGLPRNWRSDVTYYYTRSGAQAPHYVDF